MESRVDDPLTLGAKGQKVTATGPITRWEAHEVSAVVAVVVVQSTADGVVMASGATETYANPTPGKVWTPTPNSKQEWDAEALVRRDDEKDVALSEGAAVAYAWALIVDVAGQVTPLPWTVHLMLKKK